MKKLTAFLSAMILGLTAAPMAAFAKTSNDSVSAEIQLGDVNADGRVDGVDATLTLRYYTLMISDVNPDDIPYSDTIVEYGDMDGNGVVDGVDASWILRKYTEYLSESTEGDVNRDGVLDLTDACLILHGYTCLISDVDVTDIPYYDNIVKYGDMNGNGYIDPADATIALQIYSQRTGEEIVEVDVQEYLEEKGII